MLLGGSWAFPQRQGEPRECDHDRESGRNAGARSERARPHRRALRPPRRSAALTRRDPEGRQRRGGPAPRIRRGSAPRVLSRRTSHLRPPLAPSGTPFQRRIWSALASIPFGTTEAYAELPRRVGRPTAVRAVGAANGRNPLPIVLPCHRVVGADGRLVGYGGGLAIKRALLELEGCRFAGERLACRSRDSAGGRMHGANRDWADAKDLLSH